MPIDVELAKLRCWEREGDGWRGRSGKREVSVGVRSPRQSFSRGAMRKRWEQEAQEGRKDEKKAFRGCKWVEVKRECWVVVVGGWSGRVGADVGRSIKPCEDSGINPLQMSDC